MRAFAVLFGIIFLIVAIGGFVINISSGDHFFSVFHVNLAINSFHAITGIFSILAVFWTIKSIRLYFQIIGVIYAILSILGFIYGDKNIFGVLANNSANTWLHVILSVAALILGYGGKD